MKNWTNTNSTGRRAAERRAGQAGHRLAAGLLAALALATALPAQAFQRTTFADGSFEYFFAAPSMDIRAAGDFDLTELSFIEGVVGGFRVGAPFDLAWLGGEQASLASPDSTWRGLDLLPRTLSFVAGGNLTLGAPRLTLAGGTLSLTAGGAITIGNGTAFDVGDSGSVDLSVPGFSLPRQPALSAGGGTLQIVPGGDITVTGPSPIPEPSTTALLLAGLVGLAGVFGRRARARR